MRSQSLFKIIKAGLVSIAACSCLVGCVEDKPLQTVADGPGAEKPVAVSDATAKPAQKSTGPSPAAKPPSRWLPGVASLVNSEIGKALDTLDKAKAKSAEREALTAESGQTIAWNNPDTGHRGEVVPSATYKHEGTECRDIKHTVYVESGAHLVKVTACRSANGNWPVV